MSSTTPSPSKIFGLLRKSPRSSGFAPPPTSVYVKPSPDLDIAAPSGDAAATATMPAIVAVRPQQPSLRVDAKLGAFEMSIAVLKEAAGLASGVPYLGAVANIFVQIIRIKGVRFLSLLRSERDGFEHCFFIFYFFRKSTFIKRCGKR
jgi:hypothetical protein